MTLAFVIFLLYMYKSLCGKRAVN